MGKRQIAVDITVFISAKERAVAMMLQNKRGELIDPAQLDLYLRGYIGMLELFIAVAEAGA